MVDLVEGGAVGVCEQIGRGPHGEELEAEACEGADAGVLVEGGLRPALADSVADLRVQGGHGRLEVGRRHGRS